MVWPVSDVTTANADAGTDNPATFRADVLDLIQKFNQLRNHVSTNMQGVLAGSALQEVGGNVGVGITPASKLHSYNAASADALLLQNGVNGGVYARFKRPNKEYYLALDIGNSGGNDFSLFDATAGATRWTTDSAGNLGLGVVPSAWGGLKAFEIAGVGSSLASASNNNLYLSSNAWYNGTNWRYGITAPASQYQSFNGVHTWFSAPSGTAGNPITFTQNLAFGLGTTLALEGATSAAGTGIAFPATQLPSTNPNTLDDYEEGNWTPSLGGTATYTTQQGRYLKIGKQVTVIGEIQVNTLGTGSTNSIFGLPFNPVSVSGSGIFGTGACFFQSIAGTAATMTATVAPGVSWVTLYTTTGAVVNMTAPTVFTNGTRVSFTITYETA